MERPPAVELLNVTKVYRRSSHREVIALNGFSVAVSSGEFVALTGPSGSGKSTVLNLIAGLDVPTEGTVSVQGRPLAGMTDRTWTDMRRSVVGIVFQFFNLLPSISALENVALPLRASGVRRRAMLTRAEAALELVGLRDRSEHLPEELSGGEMQRVAIARALVIEPAIVLADEPTGNLDSVAGGEILGLLREYNRERGLTIVLVTHSAIAAAYGNRVITLRDGIIVDEVVNRPTKEPTHLRPVP
jgi:putative ABC transport system ATP-binding protein